MNKQKGFVPVVALIIIAAAVVFGAGTSIYLAVQPQPQIVQNISQQPPGQSQTVDTSAWKTYRNEKYGFEIRHPKEWAVSLKESGSAPAGIHSATATFSDGRVTSMTVFITNDITVLDGISESRNVDLKPLLQTPDGKLEIIPSNRNDTAQILWLVKHGSYIYEVYGNGNQYIILDAAVSTFKFIDQASNTSNWQTYRNEKYGFELKYPDTYVVDENWGGYTLVSIYRKGTMVNFGPGPKALSVASVSATYESEFEKNLRSYSNTKILSWEPFRLGDADGTRIEYKYIECEECYLGPKVRLFLRRNGLIYSISYEETDSYLNEVFSTFKFIQPTKPLITVLSPNGGETWQKGTLHEIKWIKQTSLNGQFILNAQVAISLTPNPSSYPSPQYSIIRSNLENSGTYSWNVGVVGEEDGTRMIPSGDYTILICLVGDVANPVRGTKLISKCDQSDTPFTITSN